MRTDLLARSDHLPASLPPRLRGRRHPSLVTCNPPLQQAPAPTLLRQPNSAPNQPGPSVRVPTGLRDGLSAHSPRAFEPAGRVFGTFDGRDAFEIADCARTVPVRSRHWPLSIHRSDRSAGKARPGTALQESTGARPCRLATSAAPDRRRSHRAMPHVVRPTAAEPALGRTAPVIGQLDDDPGNAAPRLAGRHADPQHARPRVLEDVAERLLENAQHVHRPARPEGGYGDLADVPGPGRS